MRIHRKQQPIIHNYTMGDEAPAIVSSKPYQGLEIHEKLSWRPHIKAVATKAKRTLAFIRRKPQPMFFLHQETGTHDTCQVTAGIQGSNTGPIPAKSNWQPWGKFRGGGYRLHHWELQQRRQCHSYEIGHQTPNTSRTMTAITTSHDVQDPQPSDSHPSPTRLHQTKDQYNQKSTSPAIHQTGNINPQTATNTCTASFLAP